MPRSLPRRRVGRGVGPRGCRRHRPSIERLESRALLAVTTTFLPDPFANVAPKVFDRSMVVEIGTPTRTPNVVFGQFDVESDPLALVSFGSAAHGTVTSNGDGTLTYAPAAGYVGPDSFTFTIGDGRGGLGTGTMNVSVIRPSGDWSTTSFVNVARMQAAGVPVDLGAGAAVVPRAVDFNGDGRIDILAGAGGRVVWFQNTGTATAPAFAAAVRVQAGGADIQVGTGRVALSSVDVDADGLRDLVVVGSADLKARWFRNTGTATSPQFAAATILKAADGVTDYSVADIRADVADWNGDGKPDIVTGSFSGSVRVALNVGTAAAPRFGTPTTAIDAAGRTLSGSYNLNVRIADINRDGTPDFVDSYNWGTINYRINTGSAAQPQLPGSGTFAVNDATGAAVNFHSLANGPIVDFADLDGDGTIDLVAGGENPGTIYLGSGQSGATYLAQIDALLAAHPTDLGTYLADPANAAEKANLQRLEGALYDYVVNLATPSQKAQILQGLLAQIRAYPQYLRLQTLDLAQQPGMPSLAAQTWLTALMTGYYDPATRKAICDAAQFPARDQAGGGYRKLVEDLGLLLLDNYQSHSGAEAIYQTIRNVPRNVYPGTGLTMADWLGGKVYLVRGHLKNNFNGYPDNGVTEYGFGSDAWGVIGDRGAENWYMTVIHHETMHDMDAFVRQSADMTRRWGQVLVYAGGHDANGTNYLAADPATGWFSSSLTQALWKQQGWWNGTDDWATTFGNFYASGPGAAWNSYGFMRGNIRWFLDAPQESLATQGNQFWNSGEGRLEVAINRWYRGFDSNITEVLFFMDVLSQGLNKIQLCENDGYSDQVISFAQLSRNQWGYIDGVTVNGREYRFTVNDKGRVTAVNSPLAPAVATAAAATPGSVTGTTTRLSILGAPTNGGTEAGLTYTWAATALPAGAATPVFSINGTNAAKSTVATFSKAGTYTFTATITDTSTRGLPLATSSVTVTVVPTVNGLVIGPPAAVVAPGGTRQFTAYEADQFGDALPGTVVAAWTVTPAIGAGTIDATGLYAAPATPAGATITATSGGLTATAKVQVGPVAVWTNAAGGSWGTATNWAAGTVPGGADGAVDFGSIDLAANATVTLDGARTAGSLVFGDAVPGSGWTLSAGTGGPLTLDVTAGTPTILVANGTAVIGTQVAGADGLRKTGAGTLRQTANANVSGGVTVDGGTYIVAAGGWYVNPFGQWNQVTVNAGATLQTTGAHSLGVDQNSVWINGGTLRLGAENYVTTLRMTGGVVTGGELRNWGGTMTFDAASATATIASTFNLVGNATLTVADGAPDVDLAITGTITNSRSLTKGGAGTLLVTGANTYTGGTTVAGGTLLVDNGSGSGTGAGAVAVNSGATLGGGGSIAGAVTVAAGATLSPGRGGVGRLSVGGTLALAGTARFEIDRAAGTFDRVVAGSTATLGGALVVTSLGGTFAAGDSFTLVSATGYSGSFASVSLPALGTNLGWDTSALATSGTIRVISLNAAPTVATAAAASPATVTGTTTIVSVLGADDAGEAALTYTWAATGPAAVTFSVNGSNAAKSAMATFTKAGSYTFTVTITDAGSLTTTSSVGVTVAATLTSIVVGPTTAAVGTNAVQQFTASGRDQFGTTLASQPSITWSVIGSGTISTSGLYTAPAIAGSATVRAANGAVAGTAAVTVTLAPPAAPTGLAATAISSSQINLAWTDASNNESGFAVDRATDAAFTQNLVTTTLPAGSTAASVTGLAAATTYHFRVRATNAAGNSANTATASAATASTWGVFTSSADIGGPTPAGSTSFTSPTYTVKAGGQGLTGTSDRFHFASSAITGDGSIVVRVSSLQNTGTGARAGVMFRDSTAANARYAGVFVTPGGTVVFQRRTTTGGTTSTTTVRNVAAPVWLRLVRTGNSFQAFYSTSTSTTAPTAWTRVGSSTTVTLASTARVGLAATSGSTGTLGTSTMTGLAITGSATLAPLSASTGTTTIKRLR